MTDSLGLRSMDLPTTSSIHWPIAAYRSRLVDGPTLTFTQPWLGRNFNPQTLVGFDIRNTVYPTGTFNSVWGKLEVTNGGALLSNDQPHWA